MKYKLTDNKKEYYGITLYQIQALIDIPAFGTKAGDLGGYIEKESNLSQDGSAWVSDNAQVSGTALIYGNAQVYDNARVSDNVRVSGNAQVYGDAQVYGYAKVYGDAQVYGNAIVSCDSQVSGRVRIYGDAQVYGNAWVSGDAQVSGDTQICGEARVSSKLDLVYLPAPKYDLTLTNAGLSIGCEFHSIKHWLSDYAVIGKEKNLTEKEIKHYYKLIKTIDKIYKAQQELKE